MPHPNHDELEPVVMLLELIQKEVFQSTKTGVAYLQKALSQGKNPDELAPYIKHLAEKVQEYQDIIEIVKFINSNTRSWTLEQILNASDSKIAKQIADRHEKTFLNYG